MKIVTFPRKNHETPKRVVDFSSGKRHIPKQNHGNRTGFRRQKVTNNNGKPWKRSRILRVTTNFFNFHHFSLFFPFFCFSSFFIFFIVLHSFHFLIFVHLSSLFFMFCHFISFSFILFHVLSFSFSFIFFNFSFHFSILSFFLFLLLFLFFFFFFFLSGAQNPIFLGSLNFVTISPDISLTKFNFSVLGGIHPFEASFFCFLLFFFFLFFECFS